MAKLDGLTTHIKLEDVISAGADIIAGKIRGRVVVDIA
jgi:acrylyl-CoA reductase (NADPH)